MPQIIIIVRDAIDDGIIRSENPRKFRKKIKELKGKELEDYIHNLWDKVP